MRLILGLLLLALSSGSGNEGSVSGDTLDELVALRRRVKLMTVMHNQMEEKGKKLTMEHELTTRALEKKTQEVEQLKELMGGGSGGSSSGGSAPSEKSKMSELQGKVGALQLKIGMMSSQLEKVMIML